jgi:hypothetical protein
MLQEGLIPRQDWSQLKGSLVRRSLSANWRSGETERRPLSGILPASLTGALLSFRIEQQ